VIYARQGVLAGGGHGINIRVTGEAAICMYNKYIHWGVPQHAETPDRAETSFLTMKYFKSFVL
jgi:hypothetical protein